MHKNYDKIEVNHNVFRDKKIRLNPVKAKHWKNYSPLSHLTCLQRKSCMGEEGV